MSEILDFDFLILERLEKSFVFSSDEIKRIIRSRIHFENRLRCEHVSSLFFLSYISFEMWLNCMFVRRCENADKQLFLRKNPFQLKVMHLFKRAIQKYPTDINLWSRFIHYCRVKRKKILFSKALASALRFCPNSSGMWAYAISSELEDKNVSGARVLAQRGLRNCSTNEGLWLKYIDFELGYASNLRERRNYIAGVRISDPPDFKYTLSLSKSVIENAIGGFPFKSNTFVLKVLRICSKYAPFLDLDKGIQRLILNNFDSQPEFLLRILDSENCMLRVLLYIYDICFSKSTHYNAITANDGVDMDYLTRIHNTTKDIVNFSSGLDCAEVLGQYFAIETFSFKVIIEGILKRELLCLLHVLEYTQSSIFSSILIKETLLKIGIKVSSNSHKLNLSKCFPLWNDLSGSKLYQIENQDEIRFLVAFAMGGC